MKKVIFLSIQGSALGDNILQFLNNGSLPAVVTVENKSTTTSVAIEYQDTDDSTTYSTITGTNATVVAGGSNQQIVSSVRRKIALNTVGDVPLEVTIDRTINFNGSTIDLD